MNFKLLVNRKLIKSCFIILLVSMFISYYHFYNLSFYNIDSFSLRELFLFVYGSLEPSSIKQIFPLIMWMYPLFLLVFYLGDDIQNFYRTNAKYIFTRTQNRIKWSIIHLIRLVINIILFYIFQNLGTFIIGLIKGAEVSLLDIQIVFIIFITQAAAGFFLLLIINLLTFFIKITYSYIILFSVSFFSFTLTGIIYEYASDLFHFVKWLPTSQFIIGWHDLNGIKDFQLKMSISYIQGFSSAFTFMYLFIGISVLSIIFISRTNRMDIY
ncbi:hypothetical protein DFR81_10588 [Garciella nitratireducens]|nr:hypothetical protein DFR81_10588 [Garciella nitratireducens]